MLKDIGRRIRRALVRPKMRTRDVQIGAGVILVAAVIVWWQSRR